ncbi:MAG TPA: helix-turn-helix transcriptional regulator [Verrucomicrobiae bacterium]|nr:helix-turn-helix transcriptional regulator [Verrucomicrobiae bacterium]
MNDERAPNRVDIVVGARARTRRLELGMSQERLAELLGVTFQQVQKYEKGVNRIASGRLYDISTALEVNVGYFFETMIKPDASGAATEASDDLSVALARADTIELVKMFSAITNKKLRRRVLDLVSAMSSED